MLNLYIKQRILKIFNLKTWLSYHLKEYLGVHNDLYGKLHKQHVSDNDKDVQVYFYWCWPRQYLHSLHNCE